MPSTCLPEPAFPPKSVHSNICDSSHLERGLRSASGAEIGIRMAIGAAPVRVIRLILGRVAVLIGIGVLVGIGASALTSRLVATLLYGLEPRDPGTLVSSAAVLAAVGALAGWLPAYRASSIDPAEVLRNG